MPRCSRLSMPTNCSNAAAHGALRPMYGPPMVMRGCILTGVYRAGMGAILISYTLERDFIDETDLSCVLTASTLV